MNPNDVIESFVTDVIRRVPSKERNDIGVELHTLLGEMLDERAQTAGRAPDDAMVLAMLREFGTPSEIASRYRAPGLVIIPADQTRSFAWLSLSGVALQWGFTLPRVTNMHSFMEWYFTWGLGALWWPGFMTIMALIGAWIRHWRAARPAQWKPREFDRDRVNRYAMEFALLCAVIGTALMIALPWIAPHLPGHMPQVLEFNPEFLRTRTWPILVLWLAQIVMLVAVLMRGRWTSAMRRIELVGTLAWLAVLGWLMTMDDIFVSKLTNDGAHFGLGLVIVMLLIDLGIKLYRGGPRLRTPKPATRSATR